MSELSERIDVLESQIAELGSKTDSADLRGMGLNDFVLPDLDKRLKELEDADAQPPDIDGQDSPDPEDPYFGDPDGSGEPYPLEVIIDQADSSKVAVRGGMWDISKSELTQISMGFGAAGDFKSVDGETFKDITLLTETTDSNPSLSADTTYWVYLLVYGASGAGDVAQASTVQAMLATTTRPDESAAMQSTSIKVLAKVTTDSNTKPTITPERTGGNIKTKALVVDSLDPFFQDSDQRASIGYHDRGNLEIYNFTANASEGEVPHCNTLSTPDKDIRWEYIATVGAEEAGGSADGSINLALYDAEVIDSRYLRFNQFDIDLGTNADPVRPKGFIKFNTTPSTTSLDVWSVADGWWSDSVKPFNHSDLADMPAPNLSANTDHNKQYWIKQASYSENFGASIGRGVVDAEELAIHLNESFLVPLGGIGYTIDWTNRFMDGDDWTVNEETIFKILDITVSDTPSANAVYTLGGFGAEKGISALMGDGNQAGLFADGTNSVKIADGTYAINAVVGDILATDGNISVLASGKAFIHNSLTGLTGDGFSGGILVNEENRESSIVDIVEMYL